MKIILFFLFVLCCVRISAQTKKCEIYNPKTSDGYYILTPKCSDKPRINGPKMFGVRPGSPFLFSIPATGSRPMKFSAEGLPKGLCLNSSTGVIDGKIIEEAKKEYIIKISAQNSFGKDSEKLKIIVGEEICLTPPMGWSSWICLKKNVCQEGVLRNAKAVKRLNLDAYGYNYVNIDDAWQGNARGGKYNAIQPDKDKFPDIKALSDELHSMGLKFGIYSTPWISSYAGYIGGSSNNKDGIWDKSMCLNFKDKTVEGRLSKLGKYTFDDNDARQWADWGVDYMKYDWNPNDSASIVRMAKALRHCGRDVVYSISNTCPLSQAYNCRKYVQVFRTGGDIRARWSKKREHLNLMENWNNHNNWLEKGFEGSRGHIPDPDFLMVGLQKYGSDDEMTADELYHHVSSYILWGAPLLISTEVSKLSEFELSLLTNVEMLDINQDSKARPAKLISKQNGIQFLVKELENGDKAIGIFNFNADNTVATMDWGVVGLNGAQVVRDVWRQKDVGRYDDKFCVNIRPHGCVVLRCRQIKGNHSN